MKSLSHEIYGIPRMPQQPREQGFTAERRAAPLKRENGLSDHQIRRFRRTTDRSHVFPVTPNWLHQNFTAAGHDPNQGVYFFYIRT